MTLHVWPFLKGFKEESSLYFGLNILHTLTKYKPFEKAKLSRNEVLQYRGENAKLKNQERKGESRCSISGCCEGIDKQCFGCHPGLLAMGIPCEQQPTSVTETQRRDCFCDEICILFEDCCDDHFGACAGLYDVSS